ncbi:hypothetical protein Tco_1456712 [Tanacetum coccineum]
MKHYSLIIQVKRERIVKRSRCAARSLEPERIKISIYMTSRAHEFCNELSLSTLLCANFKTLKLRRGREITSNLELKICVAGDSSDSSWSRTLLVMKNREAIPFQIKRSGPGCTRGKGGCSCLTYRVLELDTHSSSKADPSESSPPPISVAPMVSPFLCSNDSESDTEIPERHVSPTTSTIPEIPTAPILLAPSIIVAPSSEYPLAPVVAPPGIHRRRAILIRPGEDIPIGRLYRTHPGEPCKALIVRNLTRPLPSHCLALRHFILGHSLSEHTPPDTTDADSSTPPRFVHPSLARTLRSSAATMISPIHATRALVTSRADLFPPRKRFRDSISPKDSVEDDIDTDVLEDIEADATAVEVAVDRNVEAEIDAGIGIEVDVGVEVEDEVADKVESSDRGTLEVGVDVVSRIDIPNGMLMPDVVECLEQVEEGLQDIYDHVIEIPLQRIEDIKT